jgi:hypothetical protein
MRKGWVIGIAAAMLVAVTAVGVVVENDLSGFRSEVSDINYKLGDLENALRGSPSPATVETVHRRLDFMRDDLRLLAYRHQFAAMVYKDDTRAVWDRFARVEARYKAHASR